MADEGVAEHYQVLEELGRESSFPYSLAALTNCLLQGGVLVSSTKVLRNQPVRPSLSNM